MPSQPFPTQTHADRREISLTLTPYGLRVLHDLRDDRLRRLELVLDKMGQASRAAPLDM